MKIKSNLDNIIEIQNPNIELALCIKNKLKCSLFTAKLIANRVNFENLDTITDISLKKHWKDTSHLPDIEQVSDEIIQAIEQKKSVGIIGDYDVDGISSSVILTEFFDLFSIKAKKWIPSRKQGYGPNENALKYFDENKVDLIIMVDCGTNAHDFCKSYTNKIVIIDHHNSANGVDRPNVNPNKNNINPLEQGVFKEMCAATLTFLVIHHTLKKMKYDEAKSKTFLNSQLDLVALATVCDMMAMNPLNKAFVKIGIQEIEKQNRPGLKNLISFSKIKLPMTSKDLGFSLGPKINAAGRIDDPNLAFNLLYTKDENEASKYIYSIEQLNNYRKKIQQDIFKEAIEKAKDNPNNILCLADENWNLGVVGIVAAMVQNETNKTSIIGTINNNEIKASARSNTVDIGKAIEQAVEKNILKKGGGHSCAAGLTCSVDKWEEFNAWINTFDIQKEANIIKVDIITELSEVESDYKILSPFGIKNEEPIVLVKNLYIKRIIEKSTYHQIIIEENYENYTFFISNFKEKLIKQIKLAKNNKVSLILSLPEKNSYIIEDIVF